MATEDTPKEQAQDTPVSEPTSEAQEHETPEPAPEEQSTSQQEESLETLRAQIETLQEELAAQKDGALRAKADAQNTVRRAERDVENAHKFGLEKFTRELLPIVDNLERALDAAGDDAAVKPLREGVEMTMDLFVKALEKFQVQQIDPVSEPFDPQLHQAMSIVENNDMEPNSVVAVMQKGYTLHGRLVRPAMVVVSKASADSQPKIDEQA